MNHGRNFLDYAKFFNTGIRIIAINAVSQKPDRILYHGSALSDDAPLLWSNTVDHPQASALWGDHKDREEYFLDETYRLRHDFRTPEDGHDGIIDDLGLSHTENLSGPGLPHGDHQTPALPYDIQTHMAGKLKKVSWLGSKMHTLVLNEAILSKELQVAGWPDRNPPIQDGVTDPTHASGVLIMPQHDYSANCQPVGPDYSTLSTKTRNYVRLFHNVGAEGCSKVVLGINGINLEDLMFTPGSFGGEKIAILIKVPGLTTWMDVGRRDGEGPGKQDPFADGAGCMVLGPNTKDLSPRPQYGTKRCMIECNLGPTAALYKPMCMDTKQRTPCQLLMKVVIYPSGKDLNLEQGGSDGTVQDLKGLIGVFVQGIK